MGDDLTIDVDAIVSCGAEVQIHLILGCMYWIQKLITVASLIRCHSRKVTEKGNIGGDGKLIGHFEDSCVG